MSSEKPGSVETGAGACCGPECCGGGEAEAKGAAHDVRDAVREGYGAIARKGQWLGEGEDGCCGGSGGGGCCGASTLTPEGLARMVGYAAEDLAQTPEGANMGLSCGNPTALAALRPGEVVLDLGSGGGFDCYIAGPKVGVRGRVIGVDMTAEMVSKARSALDWYREQTGLENVEFRLGEIEHLPVADGSVDVVISNCVLNLSPDKAQVWREIARVLRPGGRVAISDLALLRPLPARVVEMVEALVGCVSGAVVVEEVERMAREAGLVDVVLTSRGEYVDAMTSWEDPLYRRIIEALPEGARASDYITSLEVAARKAGPGEGVGGCG